MNTCPKCGKELENDSKCPVCDVENKNDNKLEEVQVETQTISLDDPTPVETPKEETIILQEETIKDSEVEIVNDSLETVTTNAEELKFEEDIPKPVEIQIPDMPEPTIGEINPNLLGNQYDEEERINNEKIEQKHQQELAEMERKRQEYLAAQQDPNSRPDLLAGRTEEFIEEVKPKKKRSFGKILITILLLAVVAFALYYFLVLGK